MLCPCGTGVEFEECCGKFIHYISFPHTAEQLMRSRYSAFFLSDISYIQKTMKKPALDNFDPIQTRKWLNKLKWISLHVLNKGELGVAEALVEFQAKYIENGYLKCIHEKSRFERIDGHWFYVDGEHFPFQPKLLAQNHQCPCGSQKKFKNCHGFEI